MQYLFPIFLKKFLCYPKVFANDTRARDRQRIKIIFRLFKHPNFVVHLAIISPFSLTTRASAYKIKTITRTP